MTEKIIEINLNNKYDFLDKYNEKKLSPEMLKYIIKNAMATKKNEKIKIIINKKCYIEDDCVKLIKQGLEEENVQSLRERDSNNMRQLFFFFLGIAFIFLSTLVEEDLIWKEILIITGWVPIWEMIEVELFPDAAGRKERKIIKKLLNSEIIEQSEIFQ